MKKLFLLGLAFFVTPAFAADFEPDSSSMCIQVTQHAVSPQGVCEIFSTPCDVPANWKVISSCDLIKPKEQSTRFEDVINRRKMARTKRMQELAKQQAEIPVERRTSGQPRVGRALFTKRVGNENMRLSNSKSTSFFGNRKSTLLPDFDNAESYERFRELNEGTMPGLKNADEMTKVQKFKQNLINRGQRRPGWITSTQMKRTGYMKMDSYFSQRSMKRDLGPSRHWRELHPEKRKKFERRAPSNRRGWKGPRLEGDLGGSLRDDY